MDTIRVGMLGLLLALAQGAGAASPPAEPEGTLPPPAAENAAPPSPEDEDALDEARRSIHSGAEWLARGIDSWFGTVPPEDTNRVTDGVVSFSMTKRRDQSIDTTLHFNARLRLPNLERRTYLFVGRDNEREAIKDTPTALSRQGRLVPETRDQTSLVAGVGVQARDRVDFRLGFRGGLKPYGQARYRQDWDFGDAGRIDFRETLFWSLDDHFGSTTTVSLERAISPTLGVRWLTAGTITQVSRKFGWDSNLGAYQSMGKQRLLSLEALFSGGQAPGVGISDVGLQVRWEQPVHRDWVLADVAVGRFWPKADANSDAPKGWVLGCGVRMLF